MSAAAAGKSEIIKLLLKKGAKINAAKNGFTPLMFAGRSGHREAAKLLINRGAKINLKNKYGENSLHTANKGMLEDIVILLIKKV